MISLNSDIVSDGAFFPQPDPRVPEKEMSQDTREHVMAPSGVFSGLRSDPGQVLSLLGVIHDH